MFNLDKLVNEKQKEDNWPFRMLILGPSGSDKTHPLDKIYLYAKDLSEPKYEYLINKINKREQVRIKMLQNAKAFIEYSDDMNDVFENINEYNKKRNKKVLLVFDDMIADIEHNKHFKKVIKELFYRARKLNVSFVFITQLYFRALRDARLNSTHYVLMKIGNKKELKSIAEEKSGHLDYKDFLKIYNYCTKEPYSFMLIEARPTATKPFTKNFDNLVT